MLYETTGHKAVLKLCLHSPEKKKHILLSWCQAEGRCYIFLNMQFGRLYIPQGLTMRGAVLQCNDTCYHIAGADPDPLFNIIGLIPYVEAW